MKRDIRSIRKQFRLTETEEKQILGIAPKNIVENLIGISFSDIEGEKNGYIKDKEI